MDNKITDYNNQKLVYRVGKTICNIIESSTIPIHLGHNMVPDHQHMHKKKFSYEASSSSNIICKKKLSITFKIHISITLQNTLLISLMLDPTEPITMALSFLYIIIDSEHFIL